MLHLKAGLVIGSYRSRVVCQECQDRGHTGSVQGHAGYDPLCTSSAPSSVSSSEEASQHPRKNTDNKPTGSPKIKARITHYYCVPVKQYIICPQ